MRFTFVTIFLGLFVCCQPDNLPKTGLEGKPMPSFNVLKSDSTAYFNTNSIPKGKPIVLLLFGPYCPFSRAETESILKHMKSMQDVRFYLLTSSPYDEMTAFYKNFELNKYKNITVGLDTGFYLIKYFKITGVPFTAIYTDEKLLKQTFSGNVEAKAIEDILRH